MRLQRLMLVCLLCLGVSLQGFASVISVEVPCPMMDAAADDGAPAGAHDPDCCGDAANFAKTGKMCKMSLACHVEGQAMQAIVAFLKVAPEGVPMTIAPGLDPVSWDPSFVWRPPALI